MARKLQRQLRDLREDYATAQQKETEVNAKKNELEKQLELAEAETVLAKNDLKLAMKRIEDLQTAINVELDSESDSLNRLILFSNRSYDYSCYLLVFNSCLHQLQCMESVKVCINVYRKLFVLSFTMFHLLTVVFIW